MTSPVTVPDGAAGQRLDVFLAAALGRPRSQIQRHIAAGRVLVDDRNQPSRYRVLGGEVIVVSPAPIAAVATTIPTLPVIYQDDDLVIVDKPAGLVVHRGAGTGPGPFVADFARTITEDDSPDRPGIVHRLDQDTSGLLMIARHSAAKAFLQAALANRQIHKTYLALLVGRPVEEEARIDLPLGRDPQHPLRQAVVPGGRPAQTSFRVLARYPGYTLVSAEPLTGRTHQLRVHFAALGHHIAGDTTYGPSRRPLGLTRQFLHASKLSLRLPSGPPLTVESPLPTELQECLSELADFV